MKRSALVVVSAAAMGVALLLTLGALDGWLDSGAGLHEQLPALGLLVAVGVAVYFALALVTGAADRAMVKRLLKRRRAA